MHIYELEVFTRLFAAEFPRDQSHKGRIFIAHTRKDAGPSLKQTPASPWGTAPALTAYTPFLLPPRMQRRRAVWMARIGGLGAASLGSTGREGGLCSGLSHVQAGEDDKQERWGAPGPARCVQIRVRPRRISAMLASSSYSRCCPTSWNASSCSSTAPSLP